MSRLRSPMLSCDALDCNRAPYTAASPITAAIQSEISCSTHATALGEIRRWRGNSPRRSSHQIVDLDSPVRSRTLGNRRSFGGAAVVVLKPAGPEVASTGGESWRASSKFRSVTRTTTEFRWVMSRFTPCHGFDLAAPRLATACLSPCGDCPNPAAT